MIADITPTKSVFLELKEEKKSLQEAYAFLDEKRTILAAEIIKQLKQYDIVEANFQQTYTQAINTLKTAITYHGFEALLCADKADISPTELTQEIISLLGVSLVNSQWNNQNIEYTEDQRANVIKVQKAFNQVLEYAVQLADIHNNLIRLYEEYKRTERRTRALEDVLLPELTETLYELDAQLEGLDLEEAIRVRSKKK